jgi:glycosyltransferase involved in cell wall biosynthesis
MFIVVIRGWNCAKYLPRCVQSLEEQTNQDWRAHIVIDKSQDNSADMALKLKNGRYAVTTNLVRQGVGYNLYHGIKAVDLMPEDIVCVLDADDYLYNYALEVVAHTYKTKDCLATYGSFELASSGEKSSICKPYSRNAEPRRAKWHASHLKTFKAKIFPHIPMDYFQYKGQFVAHASDLALMMSVMEVAGMKRCQHISKVLYHYRNQTPYTQDRDMQRKYDKIIRDKAPLRRVDFA